ncbi:protein of unknown function [Bartonella clarridgeiae 73]|uniref:Uncharacterized protein n=1 Tax=Bartonella clarridgeiae (strain CCUG 45776 / CIP 104772 / 73) TaxID=696125 RepID=E6YHU9_BARC7|nr:protein of unknown function [Bartonella clarridgeiae 73]
MQNKAKHFALFFVLKMEKRKEQFIFFYIEEYIYYKLEIFIYMFKIFTYFPSI